MHSWFSHSQKPVKQFQSSSRVTCDGTRSWSPSRPRPSWGPCPPAPSCPDNSGATGTGRCSCRYQGAGPSPDDLAGSGYSWTWRRRGSDLAQWDYNTFFRDLAVCKNARIRRDKKIKYLNGAKFISAVHVHHHKDLHSIEGAKFSNLWRSKGSLHNNDYATHIAKPLIKEE